MTAAGPSRPPACAQADQPGRWYPELPPRLPGEDTASYEIRLTTGGLFDHARSDRCATGRHGECGAIPGGQCQCPHHADPAPDLSAGALAARPALAAGAAQLAVQYGLPEPTGLRLMILTREVACGGPRPPALCRLASAPHTAPRSARSSPLTSPPSTRRPSPETPGDGAPAGRPRRRLRPDGCCGRCRAINVRARNRPGKQPRAGGGP